MTAREEWDMDFKPSDNLERMRALLSRMERAVDTARDRRHGVTADPIVLAGPSGATTGGSAPAPAGEARRAELPTASLRFPAPPPSGKPKARAKSLEDFDEAFRRLAERRAS